MRKEIYKQLLKTGVKVRQPFNDEVEELPVITYELSSVAVPEHDGIGYFDNYVDIDITCLDSIERSDLEIKVQQLMLEIGYLNTSSRPISDSEYYRTIQTYHSIK